ncbi:hypothetical protein [Prevotella sp.]|uniref:hypothetical protein n=1 Tax=Prevotella sp. TaxID=59823 RepID=UPI0026480A93|nr:hypothetical protein [Prevotella sp.]MDN5554834.1 hypothetical protein [Prevotella sp.]
MKDIHYSSKAKKDLKRYRHKESLMKALYEVLQYLTNEEECLWGIIHINCTAIIKIVWSVMLTMTSC